jgi:mono/diheme cytochrome c family protein
MKRVKVVVFCVGVLALATSAAASGGPAAAAPQKGRAAQAERGRAVYADRCARCHGADGQGRTRLGETLDPPDFSDPAWQRSRSRNNTRMIASVSEGLGSMPAFKKKLSRQDIAAAVAYVRTLGRRPPSR